MRWEESYVLKLANAYQCASFPPLLTALPCRHFSMISCVLLKCWRQNFIFQSLILIHSHVLEVICEQALIEYEMKFFSKLFNNTLVFNLYSINLSMGWRGNNIKVYLGVLRRIPGVKFPKQTYTWIHIEQNRHNMLICNWSLSWMNLRILS